MSARQQPALRRLLRERGTQRRKGAALQSLCYQKQHLAGLRGRWGSAGRLHNCGATCPGVRGALHGACESGAGLLGAACSRHRLGVLGWMLE